MVYKLLFLVIVMLCACSSFADDDDNTCAIYNPIKTLKNKILCNYDKNMLPRKFSVLVTIQMLLKYIEYNDYTNKFKMTSWILMYWKDRRLRFNSTKEGTRDIYIESSKIWTLDLRFYDMVADSPRSLDATLCIVSSTGRVACLFPSTHEARCTPDVKNWPYDIQNCVVSYMAWVKQKGRAVLRLATPFIRLRSFTNNSEWELKEYQKLKYFRKALPILVNNSFSMIGLNFVLQRHSGAYSSNIIIPSLVLMFSTLISLEFDPNTFERFVVMSVSVINHLWSLLQLLFQIPAKYESPPDILYFMSISFLLSSLVVIESVLLRKYIEERSRFGNILLKLRNVLENNIVGKILFVIDISDNSENNITIKNLHKQKLVNTFKIADRLLFIILCGAYIYIFNKFMPVASEKYNFYYRN